MRFLLKLAAVLVIAICASLDIWYTRTHRPDLSKSVVLLKAEQPTAAPQSRPVYPHSVVPGGVSTGDEMKKAIATDRVVARHYSGLDPSKMKAGKLTRDTTAYVSYRVKDKTYWSKRKVRLRKGEILLGDGNNWIRARCGNLIAFVPQRPFLPPDAEPSEPDFDTPLPDIPVELAVLRVPDLTGPLPAFQTEMEPESPEPPLVKPKHLLAQRWPMGMFAMPGRPLPQEFGPLPPAGQEEIPEPSSVFLVSAGLLGVAGFRFLRRI